MQAKDERSAMRCDYREFSRFRDNRSIGAVTAKNGRQGSRASIFFRNYAFDNYVSRQIDSSILNRDQCEEA